MSDAKNDMKIPHVDINPAVTVAYSTVDLMFERRKSLMDEVRRINEKIRNLDAYLGFNDILYMDVLREENDIEVYKCIKCGSQWASFHRIPCQKCYPDSYASMKAVVLREIDYNPQTSTSWPAPI